MIGRVLRWFSLPLGWALGWVAPALSLLPRPLDPVRSIKAKLGLLGETPAARGDVSHTPQ